MHWIRLLTIRITNRLFSFDSYLLVEAVTKTHQLKSHPEPDRDTYPINLHFKIWHIPKYFDFESIHHDEWIKMRNDALTIMVFCRLKRPFWFNHSWKIWPTRSCSPYWLQAFLALQDPCLVLLSHLGWVLFLDLSPYLLFPIFTYSHFTLFSFWLILILYLSTFYYILYVTMWRLTVE